MSELPCVETHFRKMGGSWGVLIPSWMRQGISVDAQLLLVWNPFTKEIVVKPLDNGDSLEPKGEGPSHLKKGDEKP